MQTIPKVFLLPVDEAEEILKSIDFLARLYPKRDHIAHILCYFHQPLAPVYQEKPASPAMAEKKKQVLKEQKDIVEAVLQFSRNALVTAGFSDENIQEHVQERKLSVAQHSCRLADVKMVDAVVVQKTVTSRLEGFLRGDPTPAFFNHCLVNPIWFVEGTVDPSRAVVCIQNEDASLRAADHAGFMLAETSAQIELLHCDSTVSQPLTSRASAPDEKMQQWGKSDTGKTIMPFLVQAQDILSKAGISVDRISTVVLPVKGKPENQILSYCKQNAVGILVLGHSNPVGTWSFLKTSVTKKIFADFQDMALWVVQ